MESEERGGNTKHGKSTPKAGPTLGCTKTATQMSARGAGVCEPGAGPGYLGRLYVSTGAARTINAFLKGNASGLCLLLTIEGGTDTKAKGTRKKGGSGNKNGTSVEDQTGQGLTSAGLRKALGVHLRRRYIGLASITSIHGWQRLKSLEKKKKSLLAQSISRTSLAGQAAWVRQLTPC